MEDILTTMARQFLPQMAKEERAEALASLKRLIDEEFFAMAVAASSSRRRSSTARRGCASRSAAWTRCRCASAPSAAA